MNQPDETRKAAMPQPVKRPYITPRLTVYGDLRLHTWAKIEGPKVDGGVLNLTHTV